jgi:hypothetical protein
MRHRSGVDAAVEWNGVAWRQCVSGRVSVAVDLSQWVSGAELVLFVYVVVVACMYVILLSLLLSIIIILLLQGRMERSWSWDSFNVVECEQRRRDYSHKIV